MFDEKTLTARDVKEAADRAGDAAILDLFREWMRLNRDYPGDGDDEEREAALDALLAFERRVFVIPASGPIGLAIKICMLVEEHHGLEPGPRPGDPPRLCALCEADYGPDGRMYGNAVKLRGLLEDAVRFVPELAPFVQEITGAPVIRPQAQEKMHVQR